MEAEFEVWLVYGVTSTAVVFASLLVFNFAAAPYRIEKARRLELEVELQELRARLPSGPVARRLTDEQKAVLTDALRAARIRPESFNVLFSSLSSECADFAADIGDAIMAAGIVCSVHDGAMYDHNVKDRGLKLAHGKSALLRSYAATVQQAMERLGHFVERRELSGDSESVFFFVARAQEQSGSRSVVQGSEGIQA